MNPEKMRGVYPLISVVGPQYSLTNIRYGKMMYILQDAAKPGRLPFSVIMPIKTVYSLLDEKDSLDLLANKEVVQLVRDCDTTIPRILHHLDFGCHTGDSTRPTQEQRPGKARV